MSKNRHARARERVGVPGGSKAVAADADPTPSEAAIKRGEERAAQAEARFRGLGWEGRPSTSVSPTRMRVEIVFGRSQADRTLKVAFYSLFSGNLIHTVVVNITRPYKVKDAVAEITQHMLASGRFESNLQTVKLFHGDRYLGTGVYLWSPAWCRPGPIRGRPTRKTILKQTAMDRYFRRR